MKKLNVFNTLRGICGEAIKTKSENSAAMKNIKAEIKFFKLLLAVSFKIENDVLKMLLQ